MDFGGEGDGERERKREWEREWERDRECKGHLEWEHEQAFNYFCAIYPMVCPKSNTYPVNARRHIRRLTIIQKVFSHLAHSWKHIIISALLSL